MGPSPSQANLGRLLSTIVHDLRTPLNVIGLSLRMIEPALPADDPELAEDLRAVHLNLAQMSRMLAHISEFARLGDPEARLNPVAFDPRRWATELVEARAEGGDPPAPVELRAGCPAEVELDPARAQLALDCALQNAGAAGGPVRVVLDGDNGRLRVAVIVDRPPPSHLQARELRPDQFERLLGVEAERCGLELALAARVSHLFGGSARLDVEPGQRSAVVLDWPSRLAPA